MGKHRIFSSLKIMLSCALVMAVVLSCGSLTLAGNGKEGALNAEYAYNVQSYGAKGDGTSDDREAVHQALEAAKAAGGGSVYFPAGTYRLASTLSVPSEVELVFAQGAMVNQEKSVNVRGGIRAGDQIVFIGAGRLSGSSSTMIGNPVWFGARGDGVTDDTVAFETALTMFKEVVVPYREQGYVVYELKVTTGTRFHGEEGKMAKLIATDRTRNLLTLEGSNLYVANLTLEMGQSEYGTAMYFDDSKAGMEQCLASNIEINNAYTAVRDADHATNMIITTTMEHFVCKNGRNTAFELNDMWGFIFLTDVTVDYSQSTVPMEFPAIEVKDNAGMIFTDVRVIGKEGTTDGHAFRLTKSVAVWFDGCVAEKVPGHGYSLENGINYIYFYDCAAKSCGVDGLNLYNGYDIQSVRMTIEDCQHDGIVLGGSVMQLTDTKVTGCKRNGVTLDGAKATQFMGLEASKNGGYGVEEDGNNNVFVNLTGSENASGLSSLSGGQSGITTAG